MRVAIMQPYFFPYIGYFQLISAVDKFIFYDDVNFIKGGWINRNRLLHNGKAQYFTVPLVAASSHKLIREVEIAYALDWLTPMFELLRHDYGKVQHYAEGHEILDRVLRSGARTITEMAKSSVMSVCDYLGVRADFEMTSTIYGNGMLRGAARVLDICKREGATQYVNLPGGRDLYNAEAFAEAGVTLAFLRPDLAAYPQRSDIFIPGLSIVDAMMHLGPNAAQQILAGSVE